MKIYKKIHIEIPLRYDSEIDGYSHLDTFAGWSSDRLCLFRIAILDQGALDGTIIFEVGFLKFYFSLVYTPY
jgi:hypothetical protein